MEGLDQASVSLRLPKLVAERERFDEKGLLTEEFAELNSDVLSSECCHPLKGLGCAADGAEEEPSREEEGGKEEVVEVVEVEVEEEDMRAAFFCLFFASFHSFSIFSASSFSLSFAFSFSSLSLSFPWRSFSF